MIIYLETNAWWISLTLGMLGIFAGIYATEVKEIVKKLVKLLRSPTAIIIILLVIILLILLLRK